MPSLDPLNFLLRFPIGRWSPAASAATRDLLSAVSKSALECFTLVAGADGSGLSVKLPAPALSVAEVRSLAPRQFPAAAGGAESAESGRIELSPGHVLRLVQACSEPRVRERVAFWVAFRMNVSQEAAGRALERLASRQEEVDLCSMNPLERAIAKTGMEFVQASSPGTNSEIEVAALDSKELQAVLALQVPSSIRRSPIDWRCVFRSEEGIVSDQMLKWIRLRTGVQLMANPWLEVGQGVPVLKRQIVWDACLPVPVIDRLWGSAVDSQQASDAGPAPLRQSEFQLISAGANAAIQPNDPILWCTEVLLRKGAAKVDIEAMEPEAARAFTAHCCGLMERYRHPRLDILCEDLGTTLRGTCQRQRGADGVQEAIIKLNVRFLRAKQCSAGTLVKRELKVESAALHTFTHEFAHALVTVRRPESGEDCKFVSRIQAVRRRYLTAIRPHLLRLKDIYNDLGGMILCIPSGGVRLTGKEHRLIMDSVLDAVESRVGPRRVKTALRRELAELEAIYLGMYAERNLDEFMAVAFGEFHCVCDPSPFAMEVGRLMDDYFGRVGKVEK